MINKAGAFTSSIYPSESRPLDDSSPNEFIANKIKQNKPLYFYVNTNGLEATGALNQRLHSPFDTVDLTNSTVTINADPQVELKINSVVFTSDDLVILDTSPKDNGGGGGGGSNNVFNTSIGELVITDITVLRTKDGSTTEYFLFEELPDGSRTYAYQTVDRNEAMNIKANFAALFDIGVFTDGVTSEAILLL